MMTALVSLCNSFQSMPMSMQQHQRRYRLPLQLHSSSSMNFNEQMDADTRIQKENMNDSPLTSCGALGGDIRRIKLENEEDGFLAALSVPTFASFPTTSSSNEQNEKKSDDKEIKLKELQPKRMGLEALVPGAFVIQNALSQTDCEDIINACESLGFGEFQAGKNHHGAMQILVTEDAANSISDIISPMIDMQDVNSIAASMPNANPDVEYDVIGLNRRWRIYRYQPGGIENFAPHIDAGFPPSTLSNDQSTLIWDALQNDDEDDADSNKVQTVYPDDTVSRLTVLIYLNDDFEGGHTKFYTPSSSSDEEEATAAVKPQSGSVLLFPQGVGEEQVEYARKHWHLHEGSPVSSSSKRPKYVIRSDVLFAKAREGLTESERNDPLWKNDELVRQTFNPTSPAFNPTFLHHIKSLYNPHMGVENVGMLLYSLVRFTKVRQIVEIGAGYTTPWLLQALKDNDDEMERIHELDKDGFCRLLDIPWTPDGIVESYTKDEQSSSLLCIDNCLHQRETATGAVGVAKTLGLSNYLNLTMGDAYDMQFDPESIDLLWCDFGVGSRMKDFAKGAWKSIRPGGFLVCHSTLTNRGTREWLEAVRRREGKEVTGVEPGELVEISLLEPQKRYQNSVTILQRRKGASGEFTEPIYSQYA